MYREREKDEVFPWDFIHAGTTKQYLRREWEKAFDPNSAPVPNCKWGDCQKCGIPGFGDEIKLADDPVRHKAPSRTPEEIKKLVAERRPKKTESFSYKITFKKTGLSRFLPHQNMLSFFERTFLCAGIPVKFSEGFSPKPRISNMGALPLGLETYCEVISVELLQKLDISPENLPTLMAQLSTPFPRGMEIVNIEPLKEKLSKHFPKAMVYRHTPESIPADLMERFNAKALPVVKNHRGQEIDLILLDYVLPDGTGMDVIQTAKRLGLLAKIVVFSGEAGGAILKQLMEAGVNGFMSKSISSDEIAVVINSVMQGCDYTDEGLMCVEDDLKDDYETMKNLTRREMELITLCATGLNTKQLAEEMNVTPHSIENMKSTVFAKVGVKSTNELILYAFRVGLIC